MCAPVKEGGACRRSRAIAKWGHERGLRVAYLRPLLLSSPMGGSAGQCPVRDSRLLHATQPAKGRGRGVRQRGLKMSRGLFPSPLCSPLQLNGLT